MASDRIMLTNCNSGALGRISLSGIALISLLSLMCLFGSSNLAAQDILTLPSARVGVPYEYAIRSDGGFPPFTGALSQASYQQE
jgi:hypothetical protein